MGVISLEFFVLKVSIMIQGHVCIGSKGHAGSKCYSSLMFMILVCICIGGDGHANKIWHGFLMVLILEVGGTILG